MYRRSKFIEVLLEIRKEMSAEADFDVDLFSEMARTGSTSVTEKDRKEMRTAEPPNTADDAIARVESHTDLVPET
ncbi:MAG: hypothetical protein KA956_04690 [Pyrinomonadaceae bacterium]|nr:hypothetical protein [Acidobacteriota bacterium]MBK7932541.1 hypothetical protein [Acidobacteriota bacterium]MBP7375751.1 hypothetical protein [Pyrinomonadaceae bacterium]